MTNDIARAIGHPDPFLNIFIDGDYVTTELLGVGASGRVYKTLHPYKRTQKAAKILENRMSCQNETNRLKNLNHPNVVRVFGSGQFTQDNRTYYYLHMELVRGKPVTLSFLSQEPIRTVDLFRQILLGISHLHDQDFVHSDVRNANILTDATGSVAKLIDLHLATDLRSCDEAKKRRLIQSDIQKLAQLIVEGLAGQRIAFSTLRSSAQFLPRKLANRQSLVAIFDRCLGIGNALPFQNASDIASAITQYQRECRRKQRQRSFLLVMSLVILVPAASIAIVYLATTIRHNQNLARDRSARQYADACEIYRKDSAQGTPEGNRSAQAALPKLNELRQAISDSPPGSLAWHYLFVGDALRAIVARRFEYAMQLTAQCHAEDLVADDDVRTDLIYRVHRARVTALYSMRDVSNEIFKELNLAHDNARLSKKYILS